MPLSEFLTTFHCKMYIQHISVQRIVFTTDNCAIAKFLNLYETIIFNNKQINDLLLMPLFKYTFQVAHSSTK